MKISNNTIISVPRHCWILLFGLSAIWGFSFYAVVVALDSFQPLEIASTRIFFGALTLLFLSFVMGKGLLSLKSGRKRLWFYSLGVAIFTNVAPFSLLAWAQTQVSSSFAGVSMSCVPLLTLLLAHVLTHDEKLSLRKVLGLLLGLIGMIILFDFDVSLVEIVHSTNLKYKIACLCAAICYSLGAIITRRSPETSQIAFAASSLLLATIIITPPTLILEPSAMPFNFSSFIALVFLGVFSTGIATFILVYIIKKAGATFLSLVNYLVPIWAMIIGFSFNAEEISSGFFTAVFLIFFGLVVSTSLGKRV